jgi:hypothetical protein
MYWEEISVQAMNEFWPLPNLNTLTVSNNLYIPQKTIIDKDQFNERIDFNESAKSQWFGRFGWTDDFTVLPQLPLSGTTIYTTSKQYMASNTCVLSPTKVNEFRFGYSRLINNNAQELSGKRDVVKELGMPLRRSTRQVGVFPLSPGSTSALALSATTTKARFLNDKIVQALDNFSWVHRKHSLRFGGEYRWDPITISGISFHAANLRSTVCIPPTRRDWSVEIPRRICSWARCPAPIWRSESPPGISMSTALLPTSTIRIESHPS